MIETVTAGIDEYSPCSILRAAAAGKRENTKAQGRLSTRKACGGNQHRNATTPGRIRHVSSHAHSNTAELFRRPLKSCDSPPPQIWQCRKGKLQPMAALSLRVRPGSAHDAGNSTLGKPPSGHTCRYCYNPVGERRPPSENQ